MLRELRFKTEKGRRLFVTTLVKMGHRGAYVGWNQGGSSTVYVPKNVPLHDLKAAMRVVYGTYPRYERGPRKKRVGRDPNKANRASKKTRRLKNARMQRLGGFSYPEERRKRKHYPEAGWIRDPGRKTKREAHGKKAASFVAHGRAAEKRGDFSTAAIWYKKAGAEYTRAGSSTRARLWKARGADVNKGRKMGTLYRGERDPSNLAHPRKTFVGIGYRVQEWSSNLGRFIDYESVVRSKSGARRQMEFLRETHGWQSPRPTYRIHRVRTVRNGRDPSKRRIVHGRARHESSTPHHAPASSREDKVFYVLHWYSPEDRREHATDWKGSSDFRTAKREAEEHCDRSEAKRFIRLEKSSSRDPGKRHRRKAQRVVDDLRFYVKGARSRPTVKDRRCSRCAGRGKMPIGFDDTKGVVVHKSCPKCHGKGMTRRQSHWRAR